MVNGDGDNKRGHFGIKVAIIAFLMFVSFFIGATRDWITVTKEGAVSKVQIDELKMDFTRHAVAVENTYVRKDVIDAKLADMTRRLDRIEQLLLERRK